MKKYLKKITSLPFYNDESGSVLTLVCGSFVAVVACTALGMETANYYKTVSEIQSLSDSATSYAAANANSCVAPTCNLDSLVDDFANKRVNKSSNTTIKTTTTNGFWRDDGLGNGEFTADCSRLSSGSTCRAAVRTDVNAEFRTLTNLVGKNWVFKRDSSDVVLKDSISQVQASSTGSVTTFGDLCPLAIDYRMFKSDNGDYDRYWDKDKSRPSDDGYFPGGYLPDNRQSGVFTNDKYGSNGYKFTKDNRKSVERVAYLYVPKNSSSKASWSTDPTKSDYDDLTKAPSNRTTSGSKLGVGDTVWMHGDFPVRGNYFDKDYKNGKPQSYNVDNITYLDSPTNPNWWKWATVDQTCLLPVVKDIESADKGPYGNSGHKGKIVAFTSATIKAVCPGTAMWNKSTKRWDAYTNDKYTALDSNCEYGNDAVYVRPYAVIQFGKRNSSGEYSDFDGPNTKYGDAGERAEHLGAVGFKKRVYSR